MDEPTTAPAWTVTQQQETTEPGPTGNYVQGVRISFRTAGGVNGSVFLQASDYTVPAARTAIAARAAQLDAVQSLTG
jgi:hypothetical protein